MKITKVEGFKLDLRHETPITENRSRNTVDATLFMGRSFRVRWGPKGILVHAGAAVESNDVLLILGLHHNKGIVLSETLSTNATQHSCIPGPLAAWFAWPPLIRVITCHLLSFPLLYF